MAVIRGLIHFAAPSVKLMTQISSPFFARSSFLSLSRSLPSFTSLAGLRTVSAQNPITKSYPAPASHQETVIDRSKEEENVIDEVVSKVNTQIQKNSHGRLFAVVHLFNRQWKITPEDVVVIEGFWPPTVGDIIRLEKVLLVGSSDFTLVGMPLIRPDLVNIQATVIEKRLSHTKTHFKKKMRKQYQRINFYRFQQTMLRINSIELTGQLNERRDVEGIDGRIF